MVSETGDTRQAAEPSTATLMGAQLGAAYEAAALADLQPLKLQVGRPPVPALTSDSPLAVMMTALGHGLTAADLRDMLALQREWQADQARMAFNEALSGFKSEQISILKAKQVGYTDKKGNFVGYKHAELSDVVEAVSPVLAKYGLGFRWDVKQAKDWIAVTCVLKHRLGHSETVEMGGPPDGSGNKNVLQQIASTVSYLQRYTLKAITGVAEAGDDDDAGGAPAGDQSPRADTPPAEKPAYPQERFDKSLPSWKALILAGTKTADDVIATVESKATLTDEQRAAIKAIKAPQ